MSRSEFHSYMEKLSRKYHGDTYHLIAKNCNHFTEEVCLHLTGTPIPGWINRLARVEFQVRSVIVFYQKVFSLLLLVLFHNALISGGFKQRLTLAEMIEHPYVFYIAIFNDVDLKFEIFL